MENLDADDERPVHGREGSHEVAVAVVRVDLEVSREVIRKRAANMALTMLASKAKVVQRNDQETSM